MRGPSRPTGRGSRRRRKRSERASARRQSTSGAGDQTVREMTLQYDVWSDEASEVSPQLVIRRPKDLKRQKVPFVLEAIDLF